MRQVWIFVILFSYAAAVGRHVAMAASVEDFVDYSGDQLPGRLFIPPQASDLSTPRPFILFLHGAGETGTNNLDQINGNLDNLLEEAKRRGAYLYAPQATSFGWTSLARTDSIMAMVDQVLSEANGDPEQVFVTGLSMGGGGTWNMLNRHSERFAAGVPIAAVSPAADYDPMNLVDVPIWAFHARNDSVVSKVVSRVVVNSVLTAAGEQQLTFPDDDDTISTLEFTSEAIDLSYTEWPTGDHGIWGRVYDTAPMYEWMFSKTCEGCQLAPGPVRPAVEVTVGSEGYTQSFDAALGDDPRDTTVELPTGWWSAAHGIVHENRITTPFRPRAAPVSVGATLNAGGPDADRALATGVTSEGDGVELKLHAAVAGSAAERIRVQFDLEAWSVRSAPGDTVEGAFQLLADWDRGEGVVESLDLGLVSTGPMTVPDDGLMPGNAKDFRTQYDSGWRDVELPEGATVRLRWITDSSSSTPDLVFGVDNVRLQFGAIPEPGTLRILFVTGALFTFGFTRRGLGVTKKEHQSPKPAN